MAREADAAVPSADQGESRLPPSSPAPKRIDKSCHVTDALSPSPCYYTSWHVNNGCIIHRHALGPVFRGRGRRWRAESRKGKRKKIVREIAGIG